MLIKFLIIIKIFSSNKIILDVEITLKHFHLVLISNVFDIKFQINLLIQFNISSVVYFTFYFDVLMFYFDVQFFCRSECELHINNNLIVDI